MKFRSKNLLVTGGAGFIGSNFIEYLFKKYKSIKIYNLDLLTYAGNLNNTKLFKENPNYLFIQGDICNKNLVESIYEQYEIDSVVNFAAETHVDNSIENPDIFLKTNVMGVLNLLNVSYKNWMLSPFKCKNKYKHARFHQISTDEIYGSQLSGSFNENDKLNPNSPYSASKASADMLVRSYNITYGLNVSTSVCSNNYGFNQNKEKFLPKIKSCIENNISIPVYGDGLNIRDWIHVKDHCNAVDLVFNFAKAGSTYNVASGNEMTNLELINKISEIFNKKIKIDFIKDRFGHDRRYSLNCDKIYNDFGWLPKYNFKKELKNLIKLKTL
tara:strand:+ start:173 stop:1156 length:984 start_codon:yes stop_codon:yes gene_type:complete